MRHSIFVLALTLSAPLLTSCGQEVARIAPFRQRPDSAKPGALEGPFSGQVLSRAGGDPVAGALVYATWSYETGMGTPQALGFREAIASTDANGRYQIAKVQNPPKARLNAFHMVVYKRGYVAYRSDRRFHDFGPRRDFTQKNHQIDLERWNSDLSHLRHLRYVGGGAAIEGLTQWEVDAAVAELQGSAKAGLGANLFGGSQNVVAAQLLGSEEIKKITSFEGTFESGPLGDEPDTQSYSSQHFKALGQPEFYDVAVRLWRGKEEQSLLRFAELQSSLPGVTKRTDVGDDAILALEGDIQGYAFLDKKRGLVVLVTCGKGQCQSADSLVAMAKQVHSNLIAVVPVEESIQ